MVTDAIAKADIPDSFIGTAGGSQFSLWTGDSVRLSESAFDPGLAGWDRVK